MRLYVQLLWPRVSFYRLWLVLCLEPTLMAGCSEKGCGGQRLTNCDNSDGVFGALCSSVDCSICRIWRCTSLPACDAGCTDAGDRAGHPDTGWMLGRPHIGANGVSWPPWKNGWKIKQQNHAKTTSFLNGGEGWGECKVRERRYADHIFIQIYFRVHHFVAKFSKKNSSPQAARGHWSPNQNPADALGWMLLCRGVDSV